MNDGTPNARARAFALWLTLAVLACGTAAQLARRAVSAFNPDAATRPGLRLHARGVVSVGSYELNLTFDSAGYPLCVELVESRDG